MPEEVVVPGAEQHQPYDRPPLSEEVLRGQRLPADIRLCDDGFFAEHDVRLRTGCPVSDVDTARRGVTLADDAAIGYDDLVIATGLRQDLRGAGFVGCEVAAGLRESGVRVVMVEQAKRVARLRSLLRRPVREIEEVTA